MPTLKPTVVILLSDNRSGPTLFQSEFDRHPDVQNVEYSSHTYLETHHWLKGAGMLKRPANRYVGAQIYNGYGGSRNARIGKASRYHAKTVFDKTIIFPAYQKAFS